MLFELSSYTAAIDVLFFRPLYTERSNTHFPFPEYVEKQFLWLKTATFLQVSPAASEF